MTLEEVQKQFERWSRKGLPGIEAQLKMMPSSRPREIEKMKEAAKSAHIAAVLVAIYPEDGVLKNILIERNSYNGVHSAQMGFPGGKAEKFDESLEATALREANEEVAITPENVMILGQLTELYIPPSNFLVYPFLGILTQKPLLVPDPKEVVNIVEYDLMDLARYENQKSHSFMINSTGKMASAPAFDIQGNTVWGATAMMLAELRHIIFENID